MSRENMPTSGIVSRKVTKILFRLGDLGNLCRPGAEGAGMTRAGRH